MMNYKVFEDNGGGLHLAALDSNGTCVYFGSGYEYHPHTLTQDIKALRAGDDTLYWAGDTNPQGRYNWAITAVSAQNGGMQIIADNDRTYYQRMGGAGQSAFKRPLWAKLACGI